MPITCINHFEAKKGRIAQLNAFMQDVVAQVQTLPGCRWVRLLRSTENPARLAIVEVWDSVEAHQAAEKTISPEQLKKAQNLVAKPPTGEYYQ